VFEALQLWQLPDRTLETQLGESRWLGSRERCDDFQTKAQRLGASGNDACDIRNALERIVRFGSG
jgi:hypothetical protein